jgi:branched-chain amino acid aminotransferase
MLNHAGHLAECTTSNLFLVRKGRLCTPSISCGILDGITRNVVLRLAGFQQIPTEEGTYTSGDLLAADECFLTNTTMELMPVQSVNDHPIGSGKPGAITHVLHRAFRASLPGFLQSELGTLE